MLSRGVTGIDLLCFGVPPAAVPTAPGSGSKSRSRGSGRGRGRGRESGDNSGPVGRCGVRWVLAPNTWPWT